MLFPFIFMSCSQLNLSMSIYAKCLTFLYTHKRNSCSAGWPQTGNVAKDNLEFLILLPPLPEG
uniref:Short ORF n=1 Tax=Mus musculus TaxID=10090 RepID=Q62349_MOUSE|nr:unnamed protein product [Mus musculus]